MIEQMARTARYMSYPQLAVGPALLAMLILVPLAWWLATALRGSRPAAVAAAVCLSAAVTVTLARPGLRSEQADWSRLSSVCTITDPRPMPTEALLNLLLLAPFAALAVLSVGRPIRVALVAVAVSVGIEVAQAVYSVGACDSSDVVRNSAGALVAALLAAALTVDVGPGRRERSGPPIPTPSVERVGSPRW